MTDTPNTPAQTASERIAKVIARSGVASRRDAEKMILEGRVAVNGKKIASPALDVTPADRVTIDGKPIDAPQETRLWLYYKPLGLVTTEKDEQGRRTIFDELPEGMPRVLNVGRLDLNSEGLLLLTNDGGLKRRLELPETGWLRKYRVRVNGRPGNEAFDPLREGITIEGEAFQPMEIELDRQQGANAWLTVGIREGKNREIRRAMAEIGLMVNRLIRISYGPFRLNDMEPGAVVELKRKVLRDQLGDRLLLGVEDGKPSWPEREAEQAEARKSRLADRDARRGSGNFEGRGGFEGRGDREARPFARDNERKSDGFRSHRDDDKPRSYGDKPRSFGDKPREGFGDKPRGSYGDKPRSFGDKPREGFGDKPRGSYGDKPRGSYGDKPRGSYGDKPRSFGDKPRSYGDKPRSFGDKPREGYGDKPRGSHGDKPRSFGDKPREGFGDKPRSFGDKPSGFKSHGAKSHGGPADGGRASGFKSHGGKPSGGKPAGGKPFGGSKPYSGDRSGPKGPRRG